MKRNRVIAQEAFDNMLDWLDHDREEAGKKYEFIRVKLIKLFARRGCNNAEELSDETIDRVILKVREIRDSYIGDPALYFYGTAQNIFHESVRKKPVLRPPPDLDPAENVEDDYEHLESCLNKLTPRNRELILKYYQDQKQTKIRNRKDISDNLGIKLRALRMRVHRIKQTLKECMKEYIERKDSK